MRLSVMCAAFLAACLVASSASAATSPTSTSQSGSWNPSPSAAVFDPGQVASGAAVTSGNMDTTQYRRADCEYANLGGGSTRSVVAKCWDSTFSTVLFQFDAISVTTDSTQTLVWDPEGSPSPVHSRVTTYGTHPCSYLTVGAAAASGAARILCTLKSH
jgi:hypothetical protein